MIPTLEAVKALVDRTKKDLERARLDVENRPIGKLAITVDFYDRAQERGVPTMAILWAAWLVRWTGQEWRHVRRLSGPSKFEDACDVAREQADRRQIERLT